MAWQCKKECSIESCCSTSNHLACMDVCKCKTCNNSHDDSMEESECLDFEIDDYEDDFYDILSIIYGLFLA